MTPTNTRCGSWRYSTDVAILVQWPQSFAVARRTHRLAPGARSGARVSAGGAYRRQHFLLEQRAGGRGVVGVGAAGGAAGGDLVEAEPGERLQARDADIGRADDGEAPDEGVGQGARLPRIAARVGAHVVG